MLTKKQDYLEKRIEQEIMVAKKNGTKNKRGMLSPESENVCAPVFPWQRLLV